MKPNRVAYIGVFLAILGLSGVSSAEKFADFTAPGLDGKEVSITKLRNGKALVLKFGATWCPPCQIQSKELEKLRKAFKPKDLEIVEVYIQEDRKTVASHVRDTSLTILLDGDGSISDKFNVSGIPVIIVVNPKGEIIYRKNFTPYHILFEGVDSALRCFRRESFKDFALEGVDGKKIDTKKLRKDRVLVLKLGATWCGWCNKQTKDLVKLRKKFTPDKVAIAEVYIQEDPATVRAHTEDLPFPVMLDSDSKIATDFKVTGIPVLMIIDKEGKICYRGNYTKLGELEKEVKTAFEPCEPVKQKAGKTEKRK
ncbi:TlpA family protein disulfide reductase [Candidatus Hydrogenedentota bacterium]